MGFSSLLFFCVGSNLVLGLSIVFGVFFVKSSALFGGSSLGWFPPRLIRQASSELKYLISYADPNHGHVGYIYQATNWRYIGVQRRLLPERRIFIDGKETHARTLNIKHGSTSKKKLEEIYGDRIKIVSALKKHVYLMCLGNKKERRDWYKKFPEQSYPKIKENNNEKKD